MGFGITKKMTYMIANKKSLLDKGMKNTNAM